MTHYDEHTLELYLLGDPSVEQEREKIEAHLKECFGCRAFVEEMDAMYRNTEQELARQPELPERKTTALTKKGANIIPFEETLGMPVAMRPAGKIERFRNFVRTYPITTSIGGIGLAAALFFVVNFAVNRLNKDTNPSYYLYNGNTNFLEVYNKKDEKLWQEPIQDISYSKHQEEIFSLQHTVIADLKENGINEVVTTLAGEGNFANPTQEFLRIFDGNKNVVWKKNFDAPFQYLNRVYSPYFCPDPLVIDRVTQTSEKEIFVIAINNGRSPCYVERMKHDGTVLGRYWHFGNLLSIKLVDLSGNGHKHLILCGLNDTQDTMMGEFPMITVLDPAKIIGDTKSCATGGFMMPFSAAEEYYIRLPQTAMNHLLKRNANAQAVKLIDNDKLSFTTTSTLLGDTISQQINFDFLFSFDMKSIEVKSWNVTDRTHKQLVEEGKLTGNIDAAYLESLKNGIRYWDGREWRKEPTKIIYPPENTARK